VDVYGSSVAAAPPAQIPSPATPTSPVTRTGSDTSAPLSILENEPNTPPSNHTATPQPAPRKRRHAPHRSPNRAHRRPQTRRPARLLRNIPRTPNAASRPHFRSPSTNSALHPSPTHPPSRPRSRSRRHLSSQPRRSLVIIAPIRFTSAGPRIAGILRHGGRSCKGL